MAYQGGASWELGASYIAISRCPWLTALAAWGLGSTYSRGFHFVNDPTQFEMGEPDVGDLRACRGKFGIVINQPMQFAVERMCFMMDAVREPHEVRTRVTVNGEVLAS
jgi:hypothetical protein